MLEFKWLIFGGAVFVYFSIWDFMGKNGGIKKEYRNLPGRKLWQRKRAIMEAIIGVGALLLFYIRGFQVAAAVIGAIIVTAFLLMIVNNKNYTR